MSVRLQFRFASLLLTALCVLGLTCSCKSGDRRADDESVTQPDEASSYLEDARRALNNDEYDQAETMVDLASEAGAEPREVDAIRARVYRRRALAAEQAGDDGAIYDWSLEAAEVEPLDGKRFEDLMRAIRAGEKSGEAPAKLAELADRATDLLMASRAAHKLAARFWDDAGQPERALPHYQWLHKVFPDDVGFATRLASIYASVGELKAAERLLGSLRKDHPKNVQIALKLASLYEKTDRLAKAKRLYRTMIDAFPDNSGLYFRYASFLDRIGEPEQAAQMRRKAQEKLPGVERRDMRRLR